MSDIPSLERHPTNSRGTGERGSDVPTAAIESPSKTPLVERLVPYILLAMGIVLFVVAIMSGTSGATLGGAIVCVVLAAVIRGADELDIGHGLLRSRRRGGDR